jgi:hypothetical protein
MRTQNAVDFDELCVNFNFLIMALGKLCSSWRIVIEAIFAPFTAA